MGCSLLGPPWQVKIFRLLMSTDVAVAGLWFRSNQSRFASCLTPHARDSPHHVLPVFGTVHGAGGPHANDR